MTMSTGTRTKCSVVRLGNGPTNENVASALLSRGYKLGRTIGEGSYCKVKIAYRTAELGYSHKLACKIINKKQASRKWRREEVKECPKIYKRRDFVSKFLPREMSIIKYIRHPHIVTVYNIIEIDDQVYMFMDMCDRGDLLDYIRSRGCLQDTRARILFKQLVNAIDYLHSQDIAHRDLKCENVLLSGRECVKITDFGFARYCRNQVTGARILSDTFCGSAAYAAPEILQGIKYNPKMYDVWSLGCILYIMVCATMPFDDSNIKQMLKVQLHKKITFPPKSTVTHKIKKLILHCLEPDVTRRATVRQIMSSSWLQDPVRLTSESLPSYHHPTKQE